MTETYIASELNQHRAHCQYCGSKRGWLIVVHEAYGRINTEHPVRYQDGALGWDWPERIPARTRRQAQRAHGLSTYWDNAS